MAEIRLVVYLDVTGRSAFTRWFDALDPAAAARISTALYRMGQGNFSNVKGVGGGVFEYRMDSGPGYRIYFGKDGETLVVLLGGSTKRGQQPAIQAARDAWIEYKHRKPRK